MAAFIWQSNNVEHIADHSVAPEEAEYVVLHARPPYPEYIGDAKYRVRGQTREGRYLQVVYVFGVDAADVVHAMELPERDKRQYRRRRR
jgi:hypothetical protein